MLNVYWVVRIPKELLDIIQEEVEYYFEGTKGIEVVIDIINNRVKNFC